MSYGFWSPYFDHEADHEGRNQRNSYRSNTTPAISNAPSQNYPPAPSPAGQNQTSLSSSHPSIGATSIPSEHSRVGPQGHFDSRRLPPYSNAPSPLDTTAMGSLAYASSLAQERRTSTTPSRYGAMQHIVEYNQYSQPISSSAGSAIYGMTSTASNRYEPYHFDGRGAGIAREEYKPPGPQSTYPAPSTAAAANSGEQVQSYVSSSSRDNSETLASRFTLAPQNPDPNSINHPTRPGSLHSARTPHSKTIPQSVQAIDDRSSQIPKYPESTTNKPNQQRQNYQTTNPVQLANPVTLQRQATPKENVFMSQSRSVNTERNTIHRGRNSPLYQHREGQPHEYQSRAVNNPTLINNIDELRRREVSRQATDPSQVFNQYAYQNRQAAAEAARNALEEAAAKAAEASGAVPVASPAPALAPASSTSLVAAPAISLGSAPAPSPVIATGISPVTAPALSPVAASATVTASASAEADSAASRKDEMELEMLQMIEKMRVYKAKDPGLFSQIWEQVKKGQPVNRISSNTPVPAANEKEITAPKADDCERLPSPNAIHVQLPLKPEVAVTRLKKKAPGLGKLTTHPRKPQRSAIGAAESHTPAVQSINQNTSPANGSAAFPTQKTVGNSGQHMGPPPQTMHQASFPPEIVHVRGVGPEVPQNPASTQNTFKGDTVWPPHQKRILAEAAIGVLMSGDLNAGKIVSVDEIMRLLDQNLSYSEVCEKLEQRGFIINRGHFAQTLLSAVSNPEKIFQGQSSNTKAPANANGFHGLIPDSSSSNGFSSPGAWHGFGMLKPGVPQPPNMTETRNQQHNGFGILKKTTVRSHGLPSAAEVLSRSTPRNYKLNPLSHGHPPPPPKILPPAPPPLPATKKEMARKRTFSEIVDLTQQISDEDDFIQHGQRPRADIINPGVTSDSSVKPLSEHDAATNQQHLPPVSTPERDNRAEVNSAPVTEVEALDPLKFKHASMQRELLQSETIIRPMNKRNDALRRDSYNPKTIARDILVASGKHPTMTPLNYHLENLRKTFRYIDLNSDLNTLRWDLIDPGEPEDVVRGGEGGEGGEEADDEVNNADDEGAALEVGHDSPALGRQQAHVVSADQQDEVIMTDVNVPQPVKSFPSTWRPSGQVATSGLANRANPIEQGSGSGVEEEMSFQRIIPAARLADTSTPHENQTPPTSRPRGRPPGSSNKRAEKIIKTIKTMEAVTPSQPPSAGPRRRGRPLGSKDSAPQKSLKPQKSHASTPVDKESSTGPRMQSGLRNAITSSGDIAVLINPRSPFSKNTDRQARDQKGKSALPESTNFFRRNVGHKIYKCRWNDCPYELHNLQTLRKHVLKHREQYAEGPFPCCWADCGMIDLSKEKTDDPRDVLVSLEFETAVAWEQHMDLTHLAGVAWEMGDGPSAPPSDAEASDYLSDAQGRQVTPTARTVGPPDSLPLSSGRATAKEYHDAHGNKTDRAKAKALLDAFQEKKKAQGFGLTSTGERIITKELMDKVRV